MRKEVAAARGFPAQAVEAVHRQGHQHQSLLPGEMARRGLAHLGIGGEMDETVAVVHRGTGDSARQPRPGAQSPRGQIL